MELCSYCEQFQSWLAFCTLNSISYSIANRLLFSFSITSSPYPRGEARNATYYFCWYSFFSSPQHLHIIGMSFEWRHHWCCRCGSIRTIFLSKVVLARACLLFEKVTMIWKLLRVGTECQSLLAVAEKVHGAAKLSNASNPWSNKIGNVVMAVKTPCMKFWAKIESLIMN